MHVLELGAGISFFFSVLLIPTRIDILRPMHWSKIPLIILSRTMRIEVLPQKNFAQLSSIIVSISQSALPFIGLVIFSSNNNTLFGTRYLIIASALILFLFSKRVLTLYKRFKSWWLILPLFRDLQIKLLFFIRGSNWFHLAFKVQKTSENYLIACLNSSRLLYFPLVGSSLKSVLNQTNKQLFIRKPHYASVFWRTNRSHSKSKGWETSKRLSTTKF